MTAVKPALRIALAAYFAAEDPRCDNPTDHASITKGNDCPTCHLSLIEYVEAMPAEWPA